MQRNEIALQCATLKQNTIDTEKKTARINKFNKDDR